MNFNEMLSMSEAAQQLGLTPRAVLNKGKNLGILHKIEKANRYFIHEKDLAHFKIDYRKKENLFKKKKLSAD